MKIRIERSVRHWWSRVTSPPDVYYNVLWVTSLLCDLHSNFHAVWPTSKTRWESDNVACCFYFYGLWYLFIVISCLSQVVSKSSSSRYVIFGCRTSRIHAAFMDQNLVYVYILLYIGYFKVEASLTGSWQYDTGKRLAQFRERRLHCRGAWQDTVTVPALGTSLKHLRAVSVTRVRNGRHSKDGTAIWRNKRQEEYQLRCQ